MAVSHQPGSSRPLRADAERNRTRLLEAAGELFARKGLSVGLDEIARHAGVGVGTAYRRFPDKEQLIDALFERRIEEIVALGELALSGEDAWAGLVDFMSGAIERQVRDHGLRELVHGSPHGAARVERARSRIGPVLHELVRRAQASGDLRSDVGPADMPMLQIMLGGVADMAGTDTWRRYFALLLDGLRTPTPSPLPGAAPDVRTLVSRGSAP